MSIDVELYRAPQAGEADTVVVIPAGPGQQALTSLAADAVAALTPEPHERWAVVYRPLPEERRWHLTHPTLNALLITSQLVFAVKPEDADKEFGLSRAKASDLNGIGLEIAAKTLAGRWFVGMHNDALPLRADWLALLMAQITDGCPVAGVKASERNGCAHASGFLAAFDFVRAHPGDMLPDMPRHDAAERLSAVAPSFWCAQHLTQRWTEKTPRYFPGWLRDVDGDLSVDGQGAAFYLHKGGGSWMSSDQQDAWAAQARAGLGL